MKAVLISIKPEWVQKILRGEKTIEIRKKAPKIVGPFKCYIYCTLGSNELSMVNGVVQELNHMEIPLKNGTTIEFLNGAVVGEFVCRQIRRINVQGNGSIQNYNAYRLADSCVPYDQIANYIGAGCSGYAWYISDLLVYEKPQDFRSYSRMVNVAMYDLEGNYKQQMDVRSFLTKAPQSWCYVNERPYVKQN